MINLKLHVNIKWTHLIDIFVNFELLYDKSDEFKLENMNCITSDYASVTSKNKDLIHKLFHQIDDIDDNFKIISAYDNIIDQFVNNQNVDFTKFNKIVANFKERKKEYKTLKFSACNKLNNASDIFNKIVKIYQEDDQVRSRSLSKTYTESEFLEDLNKLFNQDVTVVVKGDSDIVSLKNSNSFYNKSHFGIRHVIDIARQNNYYHSIKLGSAQLEHTYMFLRYGINPKGKQIKKPFFDPLADDSLISDKISRQVTDYLDKTFSGKFKSNTFNFHNPLEDSIATFFILVMLSTITHLSVMNNMIQNSTSHKYLNYLKELNLNNLGNYIKNLFESDEESNYDSDSSELLLNF